MADENQVAEPESRRDALMAQFDAVETEQNQPVGEVAPANSETATNDRPRDEHGRFAPKVGEELVSQAPTEAPTQAPTAAPEAATLTTWRKEYLPIQQKLASGQSLTAEEAQKLAAYNVQREKEYSTGVSTYKAEAQQAKQFTDAMAEFMPTLQQHGLNPATWIQNLGRAHHTLAMGSPEQKLQMFAKLAQDYGVPLAAVQQTQEGQVDPLAMQLMHQLQTIQQNMQAITSWRQQQEDQAAQQEIAKFQDTAKYPHFEQVRESMAQLLERGIAHNPDDAYTKAVRLDNTLFEAEQSRQAAAQAQASTVSRQAAVSKAKSAAVSVRSATPSGTTQVGSAKDRRSALADAFESADAGRV